MIIKPEKAYKNLEFLNSPPARHIRILCEYEEPRQRFKAEGVRDTVVVFGSARARTADVAQVEFDEAKAAFDANPEDASAQKAFYRARGAVRMAEYYDDVREFSRRMTEWSMNREGRNYYICSGGGPGIMEAANRGAADVPGGRSVGLGISLPFEAGCNQWVTPELAFEFHYFFTRKYWFLYLAKGLVIAPGGFGTLDEFFETLTLVQTQKVKKRIPIILFGTEYWSKVFNLEAMVEFGTISPQDLDLFLVTDSVDEAYEYMVKEIAAAEQ